MGLECGFTSSISYKKDNFLLELTLNFQISFLLHLDEGFHMLNKPLPLSHLDEGFHMLNKPFTTVSLNETTATIPNKL